MNATITCHCGEQVPAWMRCHWVDRENRHYVDARDVDTGLRAGDEQSTKPACDVSPDPTEPRVIVLPWDSLVSVNRRAGGMVGWTTAEYRTARDAMAACARAQATGWPTVTVPVAVTLDFYPPDHRRRDLHNYPKATLDALTHAGVWADDSLVVDWRGRVHAVDHDEPRCVIEVRALGWEATSA